jgi:photosystem II stability/assembly factor-like uncharacterized protein
MPTTPIEFYQDSTGTLLEQSCAPNTRQKPHVNFYRLYALDKETAFIFGSVDNLGGGYDTNHRSILLRTDDGGKHWVETMTPVRGSDIQQLTFLDNGQGWALIQWTIEGPGGISIAHTSDYGQTWDKPVAIPTGYYGYPGEMQFSDKQNGLVPIIYGADIEPRLVLVTTSDGGQTWEETRRISLKDTSRAGRALISRYRACKWYPDRIESTGRDGISWKAILIPNNRWDRSAQFIIRRQLRPEGAWITVSVLPISLKCIDGRLSLP